MMQSFAKLEPIWLALAAIGAMNWAMISLFDTNVLSEIFGTGTLTDVVYTVVGFAGLMLVPMLLAHLHIHTPGHGAAHGAS